ncbi:MAG: FAD-dependent oxidoreductase [Candidatus Pacebacteria bacterium]|nr:FAD-dependent oxidoreductase [Candidatus Paceibacterota bacterium]
MYDLIILGAGPAGLSASIYASRYKINHIIIGSIFDSSTSKAHLLENWPGEKSIKGIDLVNNFYNHAKSFGTDIFQENVIEIKKEVNSDSKKNIFIVKTNLDKSYQAKSVLTALGTKHRKLNIPGEEEFLGKGVSYCAVCDGPFFKDKIVAVVGGSNSAVMAATMLSEHTNKVYLIYRGESLRCEPIVLDRVEKNTKIEIIYNTNIINVLGENKVQSVELDNEHEGDKKLKIEGLFIEAGSTPSVSLVRELGVVVDNKSCILIDQSGSTNVKGVYAAGDITNGSNGLRQIVTAASEGAIAATSIYGYLKEE